MQRLHISKLKFFNFPLKTLRDVNCRIFRDKLIHNTLRYKKDFLFAANFENGAMRFSGKKSLRRLSPFKTRIPPLSFCYKEQ